jgi:hypothetical protein
MTPDEVFVSLMEYHIIVGDRGTAKDFDRVGRTMSDAELAVEAFRLLKLLLCSRRLECLTTRCRRGKASCHAFCSRKGHTACLCR